MYEVPAIILVVQCRTVWQRLLLTSLTPQVRKLSVKRIVTPIIFDNLKNAVPGGLYDPSLGPLDPFTE